MVEREPLCVPAAYKFYGLVSVHLQVGLPHAFTDDVILKKAQEMAKVATNFPSDGFW